MKLITAFFLFCFFVCTALSNQNEPIPAESSMVDEWYQRTVLPAKYRQAELDPALARAEMGDQILIGVDHGIDHPGVFPTIADAIKAVPDGNKNRVVIVLRSQLNLESVTIPATKPFITLYFIKKNIDVTDSTGAHQNYGLASLVVESDYFIGVNLDVSPAPGFEPESVRISGDKAAFYNCKFRGFNNSRTVCDDQGMHLFKDCYMEGSRDFIFGNGKSIHLKTEIHVIESRGPAPITAQARSSGKEDTGYSFLHCNVTGSGAGNAFLGRAWKPFARVIFAYSNMTGVVNAAGWSNLDPTGASYFGEFGNGGAGADLRQRAAFAKKMTAAEAQPFLQLGFIQAEKWLLPRPNIYQLQ